MKNSKIMKVLVSLFLMVGMVFQTVPVGAEGDEKDLPAGANIIFGYAPNSTEIKNMIVSCMESDACLSYLSTLVYGTGEEDDKEISNIRIFDDKGIENVIPLSDSAIFSYAENQYYVSIKSATISSWVSEIDGISQEEIFAEVSVPGYRQLSSKPSEDPNHDDEGDSDYHGSSYYVENNSITVENGVITIQIDTPLDSSAQTQSMNLVLSDSDYEVYNGKYIYIGQFAEISNDRKTITVSTDKLESFPGGNYYAWLSIGSQNGSYYYLLNDSIQTFPSWNYGAVTGNVTDTNDSISVEFNGNIFGGNQANVQFIFVPEYGNDEYKSNWVDAAVAESDHETFCISVEKSALGNFPTNTYSVKMKQGNTTFGLNGTVQLVTPASQYNGSISYSGETGEYTIRVPKVEYNYFDGVLSLTNASSKTFLVKFNSSPNNVNVNYENEEDLEFSFDCRYFGGDSAIPEGDYKLSLILSVSKDGNDTSLVYSLNNNDYFHFYGKTSGSGSETLSGCEFIPAEAVEGVVPENSFTIKCVMSSQDEANSFADSSSDVTFVSSTGRAYNTDRADHETRVEGDTIYYSFGDEYWKTSRCSYIPAGKYRVTTLNLRNEETHVERTYVISGQNTINLTGIKDYYSVRMRFDNTKGIVITGTEEVISNLYNHAKQNSSDPFDSCTKIDLSDQNNRSIFFGLPMGNLDINIFELPEDDTDKTTLYVPIEILQKYSVTSGTYEWALECRSASTKGYGTTKGGNLNIVMPEGIESGVSVYQNASHDLVFTVPTENKGFLLNATSLRIGLMAKQKDGSYMEGSAQTISFFSQNEQNREEELANISDNDGVSTYVFPAQRLRGGFEYGDASEDTPIKLTVDSVGYKSLIREFTSADEWDSPYSSPKAAPRVVVIGEGIVLQVSDSDLYDALISGQPDFYDTRPEINIYTEGYNSDNLTVLGLDAEQYQNNYGSWYVYRPFENFGNAFDSTPQMIARLTENDLLTGDNHLNNPEKKTYHISVSAPDYGNVLRNQSDYYSLTPILVKAQAERAMSSYLPTADLGNIDQLSDSLGKYNSDNIDVVAENTEYVGEADTSVEIYGAVGAVIYSDLSTISETRPTIKVEKIVNEFGKGIKDYNNTCDTPGALAEKARGILDDVSLTDVSFDLQIEKTYNDEQSRLITNIVYPAAITFDLPSDYSDEKDYFLISEHEGEIRYYEVKKEGTKGVAYVNEFSSFALVKATEKSVPSFIKAEAESEINHGEVTSVSNIRIFPSGDMDDDKNTLWAAYADALCHHTGGDETSTDTVQLLVSDNQSNQNPTILYAAVSANSINGDRSIAVEREWYRYFNDNYSIQIAGVQGYEPLNVSVSVSSKSYPVDGAFKIEDNNLIISCGKSDSACLPALREIAGKTNSNLVINGGEKRIGLSDFFGETPLTINSEDSQTSHFISTNAAPFNEAINGYTLDQVTLNINGYEGKPFLVETNNTAGCKLVMVDGKTPSDFELTITCSDGDKKIISDLPDSFISVQVNLENDHEYNNFDIDSPVIDRTNNQISFTKSNIKPSSQFHGEIGSDGMTVSAYTLTLTINAGNEKVVNQETVKTPDGNNDAKLKFSKFSLESAPQLNVESDKNGITISCVNPNDEACQAYLDLFDEDDSKFVTDQNPMKNTVVKLQVTNHGPGTGRGFTVLAEHYDTDEEGNKIKNITKQADGSLFISQRVLKNHNVKNNTDYYVQLMRPGFFMSQTEINVKAGGESADSLNISIHQYSETESSEYEPGYIYFVNDSFTPSPETPNDPYLSGVDRITITPYGSSGFSLPIKSGVVNGNTLRVNAEEILGYEDRQTQVQIYSSGYFIKTIDNVVFHGIKLRQPDDLTTYVLTNGFFITSSDDYYLSHINEFMMLRVNNSQFTTGDIDLKSDEFVFKYTPSTSTSKGSVEIIVNKTQLDEKQVDITNSFHTYIYDDDGRYVTVGSTTKQNLNPIIFADSVAKAKKTNASTAELDEADLLATNLSKDFVVTAVPISDTSGNNVQISGAVAGAVSTDNKNGAIELDEIDDAVKTEAQETVTVTRTAVSISEEKAESIVAKSDLVNPEATDVRFDVTIKRDSTEIKQLPFKAALSFSLEGIDLPEGAAFKLVSEHDNEPSKYDVIVSADGKTGTAYVDKYSSFVLVKTNIPAEEKAVSAPDVEMSGLSDQEKALAEKVVAALSSTPIISNDDMVPSEELMSRLLETNEVESALQPGEKAVLQAYFSVTITKASADTLVFEIKPMLRIVRMSKGTDASTAPDNSSAWMIGEPLEYKDLIDSNESIEMSLPVPQDWLNGAEEVYVTHTKGNGKKYIYTASVEGLIVRFVNRHGFSGFELSPSNSSAAEVDGVGYLSLQEAVDDVANGGTVKVVSGTSVSAVVSREVSFRVVNGEKAYISAGEGYTLSNIDGVFTVKRTTAPKENTKSSVPSAKTAGVSVVTCQMAGYPADYAWNESAKACQPGYIDANGVFRSTGTAKQAVVNTYDKGIRGSVITLITATVSAIIAAYLLKKF